MAWRGWSWSWSWNGYILWQRIHFFAFIFNSNAIIIIIVAIVQPANLHVGAHEPRKMIEFWICMKKRRTHKPQKRTRHKPRRWEKRDRERGGRESEGDRVGARDREAKKLCLVNYAFSLKISNKHRHQLVGSSTGMHLIEVNAMWHTTHTHTYTTLHTTLSRHATDDLIAIPMF